MPEAWSSPSDAVAASSAFEQASVGTGWILVAFDARNEAMTMPSARADRRPSKTAGSDAVVGATGTAAPMVRVELAASTDAAAAGVALVTLDRPAALNALSFQMVAELAARLEELDADPRCRVAVIAGSERAFAAGADVRELAVQTTASLTHDVERGEGFAHWDRIAAISIPIVAAVRGLALGGGCELAMACDIVVAGEGATFGQPEIRLGIIPGAGGTQRLPRAVGRALAMDMILTGRSMTAAEALASGLVSRVVPDGEVVATAVAVGAEIARYPRSAVAAAKQAVNAASQSALGEGLARERQAFFALFGTAGQREGLAAFLEKRPPSWGRADG